MNWKPMLAAFFLVALLGGCKAKKSVVGSWTATPPGNASFTFKADDTFSLQGPSPKGEISATGTYAATEDHLSFTPTAVDISKLTLSPVEQAVVKQAVEKQMKQKQEGSIKWNSDDQFVFTATGLPKGSTSTTLTFDRKKG